MIFQITPVPWMKTGKEESMSKRTGFVLIEVMILVVIIGILAAIMIPNYVSMRDRAREETVRINAQACELFVQDEARKNYDLYPARVADLLNARPTYKNPFGDYAFVDGSVGTSAGVCYYTTSSDHTSYLIIACGKNGTPILRLSDIPWRQINLQ